MSGFRRPAGRQSSTAADGGPEFPPWLQLLLFAAVGVLNTVVDITAFWMLVSIGASPFIANPVSFALGAANSLLLNHAVTFRGRRHRLTLGLTGRFLLVTVCMLGISQGVLIGALHMGSTAIGGKACAVVATLAAGFWINRSFTFRRTTPPN